jgi:hypothetical protein
LGFQLERPPADVRLPSPDETAAGGSRDQCPDSEVRSICRDFAANFGIEKDTRNVMILVPLLNPKFGTLLAVI